MATLKDIFEASDIDMETLIQDCGISNFIETGTGLGDTVDYCLGKGLEKIISVEIYKEIAEKAIERFKNSPESPTIIIGDSASVLPSIVYDIEGRSIFWLDAHFPGVDFKYAELGDEQDENKRIPLKKELEIIVEGKDTSKDIFIIDDLRIYEDGEYEDGNWELRNQYGGNSLDFVYDAIGSTHNIEKYYRHQGFLICLPKEK